MRTSKCQVKSGNQYQLLCLCSLLLGYILRLMNILGLIKMANILQTTIYNAFCVKTEIFEFSSKFKSILFRRVQFTRSQHLFRYWIGVEHITRHYPNQWWQIFAMPYNVTISQCVNTRIALRFPRSHLSFWPKSSRLQRWNGFIENQTHLRYSTPNGNFFRMS